MTKAPLKPNPVIDIADGEFLHYSEYAEGRKYGDNYFVARKITSQNGEMLYKIYSDRIPVACGKKLPENYTCWPYHFIIDPKRGCLLECEGNFDTNELREFKDLIYYHYQYDPAKSNVEYHSKSIKNGIIREKNNELKLNPDYPFWSVLPFVFYTVRFLDTQMGGKVNYSNLEVGKMAVQLFYQYETNETIQTGAGTFNINKAVINYEGVPFPLNLIVQLMKKSFIWVEDSNRKMVVKFQGTGGSEYILEEIGNKNPI